ncbi:unannotated protein [freshwater metagenome]|uniref:Unannotated protein n=1 Tax=freshwater metagenome TaxID=449393 RepID=A0A6J7KKG4_9ZZZZ
MKARVTKCADALGGSGLFLSTSSEGLSSEGLSSEGLSSEGLSSAGLRRRLE